MFRKCLKLENESTQDFSARLKKSPYHFTFSVETLKGKYLEQFSTDLKSENFQIKLNTKVDNATFQKAIHLKAIISQILKLIFQN